MKYYEYTDSSFIPNTPYRQKKRGGSVEFFTAGGWTAGSKSMRGLHPISEHEARWRCQMISEGLVVEKPPRPLFDQVKAPSPKTSTVTKTKS